MLPHIANFLLELCLFFCAAGMLSRFTKAAAVTAFLILSCCFGALIYAFVVSDFSLKLVFENSHSLKPMFYKISGTWGNHEGSVLMLTWMVALYGFLYSLKKPNLLALKIQTAIVALLSAYIFAVSNPFITLPFLPANGMGQNPLLQDVGLATHPPILYMGYVGFSLVFSIAMAFLLQENVGRKFATEVKLWVLVSWSFLTLGIVLGAWWAYRELGWGGFWFWDPVENASLMPWLGGCALVHTIAVVKKRNAQKKWAILLSIITFALCLIGFFLVRSGALTSVHSFASDPARGSFMLGILFIICTFGFGGFALKSGKIEASKPAPLLARETGILFNNLVLMVLLATIFLGTLYPLLLQVLALPPISVGAPYFNATFMPMAALLLGLAGVFMRSNWMGLKPKKLIPSVALAFVCGLVFASWQAGLVMLLLFSSVHDAYKNKFKAPAMTIAHIGIGLVALGIFLLVSGRAEYEGVIKEGEKTELAGYEITLKSVETGIYKNYAYRRGIFEVWHGKTQVATLKPETRLYPIEQSVTTESALYTHFLSDLYVVIGEPSAKGGFAMRAYYKPFMNLVWIGAAICAFGGFLGAFYRKKRVF